MRSRGTWLLNFPTTQGAYKALKPLSTRQLPLGGHLISVQLLPDALKRPGFFDISSIKNRHILRQPFESPLTALTAAPRLSESKSPVYVGLFGLSDNIENHRVLSILQTMGFDPDRLSQRTGKRGYAPTYIVHSKVTQAFFAALLKLAHSVSRDDSARPRILRFSNPAEAHRMVRTLDRTRQVALQRGGTILRAAILR
jgi:hypothetical protein